MRERAFMKVEIPATLCAAAVFGRRGAEVVTPTEKRRRRRRRQLPHEETTVRPAALDELPATDPA
jgi:hypothetical protein